MKGYRMFKKLVGILIASLKGDEQYSKRVCIVYDFDEI